MRYHQNLRAELDQVAEEFFYSPSVWNERVYQAINGELVASNKEVALEVPVPVRILGQEPQEPTEDFWFDLGLRDTIARAWHREASLFTRDIREG